MKGKIISFNPLTKKNLASSVADALLNQDVHPLSNFPIFEGAGIYAIYYVGNFSAYEKLSRVNRDGRFMLPIYIGKAVPAGSRMGNTLERAHGKALHKRLKEHADSINAADNLDILDFHCRFLVVDDIWIPLGEALMIARFTPVWNSLIDGFGNHNPGKGRHAGMCPRWDVLHPGREWATHLAQRSETQQQIAQDAQTYLEVLPAFLLEEG